MSTEHNNPECLCVGVGIGIIRVVAYGIAVVMSFLGLFLGSFEGCRDKVEPCTKSFYDGIPKVLFVGALIICGILFIIHVCLLVGIFKRNHKLIYPAVVIQGIEFGLSLIFSVLQLLNPNIIYIFGGIVTCILNYLILNAFSSLHSSIEKRNESNLRANFNARNRNVDLNV